MTAKTESRLARAYRKVYETLCGRHPRLRPWHFQYLDALVSQRLIE